MHINKHANYVSVERRVSVISVAVSADSEQLRRHRDKVLDVSGSAVGEEQVHITQN